MSYETLLASLCDLLDALSSEVNVVDEMSDILAEGGQAEASTILHTIWGERRRFIDRLDALSHEYAMARKRTEWAEEAAQSMAAEKVAMQPPSLYDQTHRLTQTAREHQ